MDQPLGEWVGNSMEVYEAIETLNGRGPADTRELCVALCAEMLVLAGQAKDRAEGRTAAEKALSDGSAARQFEAIVKAQGGDPNVVKDPLAVLPAASKQFAVKSAENGYMTRLDALSAGEALRALGGGRIKIQDKIDHAAALRLRKKIGDPVKAGETVIELYYNDDDKLNDALGYLKNSWSIGKSRKKEQLILDRIAL